jgi:hypothetical protein
MWAGGLDWRCLVKASLQAGQKYYGWPELFPVSQKYFRCARLIPDKSGRLAVLPVIYLPGLSQRD